MSLVSIENTRNQRMADHILGIEKGETYPFHAAKHIDYVAQPGTLPAG